MPGNEGKDRRAGGAWRQQRDLPRQCGGSILRRFLGQGVGLGCRNFGGLVSMSWLYLAVAILFEIVGTSAMKMSDGMTRAGPAAVVVLCYGVAFVLLAQALRTIEVGIAYAIWSAAGTPPSPPSAWWCSGNRSAC